LRARQLAPETLRHASCIFVMIFSKIDISLDSSALSLVSAHILYAEEFSKQNPW
jgi:hypothetical protein